MSRIQSFWGRTPSTKIARARRQLRAKILPCFYLVILIFTVTASSLLSAATTSLVGYWPFHEGAGTTATDLSGKENTGTLVNGPTWGAGKFGYGLSFNGSDQYVEIAHSDSLSLAKQLTVSAWIYNKAAANSLLSDPEFHIIAAKGWAPDAGGSWTLAWDKKSNDLSFCVRKESDKGYNCVFFSYDTLAMDWHHIAAVFNSGKISLYVDGSLAAGPTALGATRIRNNTEAVRIGAVIQNANSFLQNWDGDIDDVQIHNQALTNAEIKSLYQATGYDKPADSLGTDSMTVSQTSLATSSGSSKSTVATPVITPNGGSYSGPANITLTTSTSGAFIYYTTDGTSPTQSSKLYKTSFTVAATTLVKAKAFKQSFNPSSEASGWFSIGQQFDFSLSNTGDKAANKGSSVQNSINAALKSGSSQPVSFLVSGLPSGTTASFSNASCGPSCSSTLTVITSSSTPAGTFPIAVTGSAGGISRSTSFNLTVSNPVTFDFSLTNSGNKSVTAGSSVSNTISATLASGSAQAVSFSVSGLPSGATGSFSSASCTPTCSAVLNIATSGSTPTGNFSVTVSATGGGITRTTAFTLTVAAPTVVSTVATPTITPNGGGFTTSVSVTLTTSTSGASIYYTTDGSSPTQSSKLYTGAMTLNTSAVVKAKGFKSGYNASAEASALFISDLVAYWKFDEGTGTTTADSSGNGNTGALVNGPQWRTGIAGKSLYFDGTDDNVAVLNSNTLNPSSAFTVTAWVNPAATFTDFRSILVKNYKYYLYSSVSGYCGDGSPLGGVNETTNTTVCQPSLLPINTWTHLGLTSDGSTLTLYRDSVAVATSTAPGALPATTGNLQIGASEYGEFFKGLIDEVRIYNRALSGAEIQTIYRQNAPVTQPFDFTLSNSGNISLTAGSSGSTTVNATLASGSTQSVSFSVSGLPSGITGSFSSAACALSCSSLLTISTSGSTPTGTYQIMVSSTGGGVTRTTAFTLSITASVALVVATPTITPTGGSFSGSVSVAMQTTTSGAAIYYTTDGSTPTQSSSLYTGAMTLTRSATVNSKAFKAGYNASAMASAAFTTASNKTYYVAKTGSDNNSCSQAQNSSTPKLTITAALACVGSAGSESGAGYSVQVASGIYNEVLVDKIPSGSSWSAPFTLKSASTLGATLRPSTNGAIIGINNIGHYIVIDGFTIDGQSQTTGTGIALSAYNWGDIHHLRIINNEIKNVKNDGITGGHGTYLEIVNNSIHDVGIAAPGYAHGIYAVVANSIVEKNRIVNSAGYGLHFYNNFGGAGMDGNIVRYNILNHNGIPLGQAAILASGSNMQIYGNIMYSNANGIWATQGGSNIYIYNNSIYGNSTYGILNTTVSGMIIKNNISYRNTTDLSAFGTGAVQSNNLLGVDPLFVDPASANFNLKSGSPAIGSGTCLISTALTSICSGGSCDIGAYQYQGGFILSQ